MTDPLDNKPLAYFGRLVVEQARDVTIRQWDRTIDDGLERRSAEARRLLDKLGPDAKELLRAVIPEIVDTTLHQMMFLLEQGDFYGIRVAVTSREGEECSDLAETSDGLAGDLIQWTAAFSKERHRSGSGTK